MSIVDIKIGQIGVTGADGVDGVGVGEIDIVDPLSEAISENFIGLNIEFDRDSEATYTDRYGRTTISPAARIEQALYSTNDLSTEWVDLGGTWEVTSTTEEDPEGGNTASAVTITSQTGTRGFSAQSYRQSGQLYHVSVWVKVISGTINGVFANVSGRAPIALNFDQSETGWQRITGVISSKSNGGLPNPSSLIDFVFDTDSAVVHLWQFNATLGVTLYDTQKVLTPAPGAPQIINNPAPKYRQSDFGTLIEGDQRNLAPNSDLLPYWTLTGVARILPYSGDDIFGRRNSSILLDGVGATDYSISNTLETSQEQPTDGQVVYVSVYMAQIAGSEQQITISMGNGGSSDIEDLTDTLERYFFELKYGDDNTVTISVSGDGTSQLLVQGLQVTTDPHGSYIPTGDDSAARLHDSVSAPFLLSAPNTSEPWTLLFDFDLLQGTPDKKTVVSSDNGDLDIYVSGSDLTLKTGATSTTFAGAIDTASKKIAVVYDGANATMYDGFDAVGNNQVTLEMVVADRLNYGTANGGLYPFGAYISNVRFLDTALNSDQIKYYSNRTPSL